MSHEYKCPDCGSMVSPVPFIGRVPEDADTVQRKYACTCGTVFLVSIELNQTTLTDFDNETVDIAAQRTDTAPIALY